MTTARDDPMPPATKTGAHGRAWRADLSAMRKILNVDADADATLDSWVVETPWAHPFWHSYWIALVHLRPMPDARKTLIYRDDATHEFWVYALNPEEPRADALMGKAHFLTPGNFAAQLAQPSDDAARAAIEGAVDLILSGELNPDTDARRQWRALFGDAMIKPEWR